MRLEKIRKRKKSTYVLLSCTALGTDTHIQPGNVITDGLILA